MRYDYDGAAFWISGASSGLGAAIAREAAARGGRLVLSGRDAAALELLSGGLRGPGGSPAHSALLPFDLADPDARGRAAAAAPSFFGAVDVLVLAAGLSQRALFLETEPEVFDRIMEIDFRANVDILRRVLPSMVERSGRGGRGCRVILVSSLAGLAGSPLRAAYSSAKHALAGLAGALRAELYGSGVGITTVFPGFVRTEVSRRALDGAGRASGAADPRIERGADPAGCARRALAAAARGRPEIKVAFGARGLAVLALARAAPGLWARVGAREARKAAGSKIGRQSSS